MTLPSRDGQIEVINAAYRLANISPSDTTYIECHGTGTPVGDPIEVLAIHQALGASRPQSDPILIGSVSVWGSISLVPSLAKRPSSTVLLPLFSDQMSSHLTYECPPGETKCRP